ncbi:ABC transporter ATP-binding protein [Pelagibius marinus]|uniref:ABC transporter ATP-binding protein n=1 Tax=Pelagibius marinus TaxID=2762760 RepID=UPI00187277E3|nr:oligopeptide/dipeptide ABC transporter ATP-binding protein [Pelagibius marinus]
MKANLATTTDNRVRGDALIELVRVSRSFEKKRDVAVKIANTMGLGAKEEIVQAVDRVDLVVRKGEVVGLVGESGCGKSTLGRMVAGILPPSSGSIYYGGKSVSALNRAERRAAALAVQMIFQDPFASLNPRMRVKEIIAGAPLYHGLVRRSEVDQHVDLMMERVGLDKTYKRRYPHQFSGGQRQRIGIARALAVNPKLIVCDESVAALDVSIQAQVLNLFMKLRQDLDLTYLFISHDLGVVEHLADRVAIMYLGRIVEEATTAELFSKPNHPYTTALLKEVPRLDSRHREFQTIKGEIPSPINPPSGCHFHPRCPHAMSRCRLEQPKLMEVAPGRLSACHLNDGK